MIKKSLLLVPTFISVSLMILMMLFNTFTLYSKSKTYLEKDASLHKITSSIQRFGQKRWKNNTYKVVNSIEEIQQLYNFDWSSYALKTVVIDPGHGGKDDGTSSVDGAKEKNIVLSIAKQLGSYITVHHPSVKVVYTRKTDVFISLKKRADIANYQKADLFISIHCNYFKKSFVRGSETYVMGMHRAKENLEVIKRENDVVLLEENYKTDYEEYGVDKNSPLYDILINSYQNAYLEQSLTFAQLVENQMKANGHHSRGVHQAGFLVLRRTAMPSVLVETGYLSNASDKVILNSKKGQTNLARQIYYAFNEYKKNVESQYLKEASKIEQVLPNNLKDTRNEDTVNIINTDISFAIQLASVEEEMTLEENKWKDIRGRVVVEKSNDGLIRYLIKDYGVDYQRARKEKQRLRKEGFVGCFVVAFKKDKRIELYKAKRELGIQ